MHKMQEILVTDFLLLKVHAFKIYWESEILLKLIVRDYWHISQFYESRYLSNFKHMGKGVNESFENANRL